MNASFTTRSFRSCRLCEQPRHANLCVNKEILKNAFDRSYSQENNLGDNSVTVEAVEKGIRTNLNEQFSNNIKLLR